MPENIAEPLLKWYDKNKRLLPWRDKDNDRLFYIIENYVHDRNWRYPRGKTGT